MGLFKADPDEVSRQWLLDERRENVRRDDVVESPRFGKEYRAQVKARILGGKPQERASTVRPFTHAIGSK